MFKTPSFTPTRAGWRMLAMVLGASLSAPALAQGGGAAASPVVVNSVKLATASAGSPMTGTVHSRRELQITAGASGRLLWIAEPGSQMAEGDVLARIDAGPVQLQLAEQRATLQRLRVNLDYLTKQLERRESLSDSAYVSEREIDEARSQRDLARADIAIAEARIAQLRDQVSRTEVTAPFPGVVADQRHYAGEEVARGQALARLVDTSQIEVRAALPLRYFSQLATGDTLKIESGSQSYDGVVRATIAAGDVQSQTFEARIDLPGTARSQLAVGQVTRVMLPIDTSTAARSMLVPRDAVVLRRNGNYVFRINQDGVAERVTVTLGRGQDDWIAVEPTEGELAEGDRVAVRGAERLQPGQTVEILRDLASEEQVSMAG